MRRLTSDQLINLFGAHNYQVKKQWYACQYYGALNWITEADPGFVRRLLDPEKVQGEAARQEICSLRKRLYWFSFLRKQRSLIGSAFSNLWNIKILVKVLLALPFYFPGRIVDRYIQGLDEREWVQGNDSPEGSEMYMSFEKSRTSNTNET